MTVCLVGSESVGRPIAKWLDDNNRLTGKYWLRLAQNKAEWRRKECSGLIKADDHDRYVCLP